MNEGASYDPTFVEPSIVSANTPALVGNAYTTKRADLGNVLKIATSGADATVAIDYTQGAGLIFLEKTNTDGFKVLITDGSATIGYLDGADQVFVARSTGNAAEPLDPIASPYVLRAVAPQLPATPPAGFVTQAMRSRKGVPALSLTGENGQHWPIEYDRSQTMHFRARPVASTTSMATEGGTGANAGTITTPAYANTNIKSKTRHTTYDTGSASAHAAGFRLSSTSALHFCGTTGFMATFTFGMDTDLNGGTMFAGLQNGTADLTGDASALTNMIGIGFDAADSSSGFLNTLHNDGSGTATKSVLSTFAGRSAFDLWKLQIKCDPAEGQFWMRMANLQAQALAFDWTAFSSDIPSADTTLSPIVECHNRGVASNMLIAVASIDIVSNYGALL